MFGYSPFSFLTQVDKVSFLSYDVGEKFVNFMKKVPAKKADS